MSELRRALSRYRDSAPDLWCTGHHQGRYGPQILNLGCDLTELAGLDNLQQPEGGIAQAQARAAQLWGAEETAFLVNGASVGLQSLILGCVGPGEKLLLPRNVHQSVIGALILGGIQPIWLEPNWDEQLGIASSIEPCQLAQHLGDPALKALLLVYPTYYGACGPLAELVQLAHERGLPVLVDSAHGSHLRFHRQFPPCPVQLGCDGVVQSTHKTGGSLTQSAMLHLQGARLDRARILRMLRLLHSTSPSYLLLASLAETTEYLAAQGELLWARALQLALTLRAQLAQLPGCRLLAGDPTRITLTVPVCGFELEEFLIAQNIHPELSGPNYIVFVLTPAHDQAQVTRLLGALRAGLAQLPPQPPIAWAKPPHLPVVTADLRGIALGPQCLEPLTQCIGRTSAQTLSLYPPGIPILLPGEKITVELVAYIETVTQLGGQWVGWQRSGWLALAPPK